MIGWLFDRRRRKRMHAGFPASAMYQPFRYADALAEVEALIPRIEEVQIFCGNSSQDVWIKRFQAAGYRATGGPWPYGGGRIGVMRPDAHDDEVAGE